MATMNVKDAAGQDVPIEKPLAPGRAAAVASRPVALSTEDLAALASILAAVDRTGTRTYGTVERVSVGAAANPSGAITATEVLLHASVKCYVLAGSGTPSPTASTGIPLEAGEKFHMRITSGHKIGVIRDAADGYLHIAPVV